MTTAGTLHGEARANTFTVHACTFGDMASAGDDRSDESNAKTSEHDQLVALQEEVTLLRLRLADAPKRVHSLEERLLETKGQLAAAIGQNEKLSYTLREAREQFEREYLVFKLQEAGGSVGKLSDAVGMERTHLYRKLRSLGVDPKKVASGDS